MRRMLAVALNDLKIELSDRGSYLMLLLLPLVFTFVIGAATGGRPNAQDIDTRIGVDLVDLDGGAQSAAFTQLLSTSALVRTAAQPEQQALERLKANRVAAVVVVPAGFTAELLAGRPARVELHTATVDSDTLIVRQGVLAAAAHIGRPLSAAAASLAEAERIAPFPSDRARSAFLAAARAQAEALSALDPVRVDVTVAPTAQQPEFIGGYNLSSPGQLVTWVLSTLLAGSVVLVDERTKGTLRRLLVMPASKGAILAGKILGRLTLGMLQMAVMIVFGAWVLGVAWGHSPVALALVALSFGLAATALGMFLATLTRTPQQAGGLVTLGTFLLAPLGGAWVPLEITPEAYRTFAQLFPTTWAMRGFTDVVVRGQGVEGIWLEVVVLLGFAALFFALGIWRFRFE